MNPESPPSCPFALFGPEVVRDPNGAFATLRAAGPPLHLDERSGVYVAARHAVLTRVVRDPQSFSNKYEMTSLRPGGMPAEAAAILADGLAPADTLLTNDPPDHGRYRALVERIFTAERVAGMQRYIAENADELIDGFIADGEVEIVAAFASPLPLRVIVDALGLDRSDLPCVKRWSDAISEIRGLMVAPERVVECARLVVECQNFLQARCAERRAQPRDDILTALVQARIDDRPLTPEVLNSLLFQLMVAGNESCTNALAAGIRRLATDPSLPQALVEDDRRLKVFVEEVLRLDSPAQGHFRRAVRDVDVDGVTVPEGALVHVRWASANRDEAVFPDPETLDLTRRNPTAHVAFGGGPHFCVGASLGRGELRVAFRLIAERLRGLALAPDNDFAHHPIFHLRGLQRLNVVFEPQSAA